MIVVIVVIIAVAVAVAGVGGIGIVFVTVATIAPVLLSIFLQMMQSKLFKPPKENFDKKPGVKYVKA